MTNPRTGGSLQPVVDGAEQLLDRAGRAADPEELVVTPERLHRRNLKRRLAARARPRSSIRLTDASTIAEELLDTVGRDCRTVDRVDRLKHVEALLEEPGQATARLETAFGSKLAAHTREVAAAHQRVAAMTAWEPERLVALTETIETLPSVAARDAGDIVSGVRAVEAELTEQVGPTHSREALLREAASLLAAEPARWQEAFPTVERLSVAGISAVDAPLLNLLTAAAGAGVAVSLYLRPGTGPAIADRLSDRVPEHQDILADVEDGEFTPSAIQSTELVADTPEAEARLAAAIVAGLLRDGVSPSDVLIVARDGREYERRLRRAAERQGFSLTVWAQLPVERTLPYRLFDAVCELLGTDEPALDTLLAPLEFRWVLPATAEAEAPERWPLSPTRVAACRSVIGESEPGSVGDWRERLEADAPEAHQALEPYLDWLLRQPESPLPGALHDTFEPLLEAYREVVLPETFAGDSADLGRTAQLSRAIVRVEELLVDTRAKYDEWLAAGDVQQSWLAVADLAERVVATRPGRREHANAAAIDVVDATDAWLMQVPHVVALGLVDGVWPRRPESVFPQALRAAVVAGDSAAARQLAVPGRWTAARETDHLASAVDAGTEQVIATRYRRTREGSVQERSPLLSTLSPRRLEESAQQSLLETGVLPDALAPASGGDAP